MIKGQTVRLNNIFFEYDKSDLNAKSYSELDRLVDILNANPEIKIEIQGHTDNQGSAQYNLNLSEKRAQSVYNYIVDKGIDASRLLFKGLGAKQPISGNDTETGRAQNRRIEFIIR